MVPTDLKTWTKFSPTRDPCWWHCLGRTGRCALVGEDASLGADFEVSKGHSILSVFSLPSALEHM